jgi:hypothetical protein
MNKKFGMVAIGAAAILALTGCDFVGTSNTTPDPVQSVKGTAATFVVITDWRTLPSNSEGVTDVHVRIVKIEDVCYLHSGSHYDYTYSFVPTGKPC